MRLNYILLILIFFQSCSFDNKSGIWKNENIIPKSEEEFDQLESVVTVAPNFEKIIPIETGYEFRLSNTVLNKSWSDIYYSGSNNYKNFEYKNANKIFLKSRKISRNQLNKNILFENGFIISSDNKGNIIVFSVSENQIFRKINFYKKKYKKVNKILNMIVENDTIYISDNLGYLYAYNYIKNKYSWAKNYKIPFRSNLKIHENKLIAVNQNNNLFYVEKKNGEILKSIPTEETILKNNFINNLSIYKKNTYFLNTYGSLYSISNDSLKINWFINLNESFNLSSNNLFQGNQIISESNKIVVSSNKNTYVIDANSGLLLNKKKFSSKIKPLIINNYFFTITKKNLLVSMELSTGKIIYSNNINDKIAKFLNSKKKSAPTQNLMMADDKLLIFLDNSFYLKANVFGEIIEIEKLPSVVNSNQIIVNGFLIFINKQNKIYMVN